MPETVPDRLFEIEQQYHHLRQIGAYAEALELVSANAHLFPAHEQGVIYLQRASMACRLKDRQLAIGLLQEWLEAGHWYGQLADEPDFLSLRDFPEFARILSVCTQRREQAIANAVPVIEVWEPQGVPKPWPVLIALHGAQSNIQEFAPHWLAAAQQGWLVALPQSSEPFGTGTYSWNDWDWARQELQKHFEALDRKYAIDHQRVVLAGFSQGGGFAAWLALTGAISASGLLLVGPFLEDADAVTAWMKDKSPNGIKAYLVAGAKDVYCLEIARRLAEIFPQHGIPVQLDEYADLDHSFPVDFEARLPLALEYLGARS
jgi:predicted esterase